MLHFSFISTLYLLTLLDLGALAAPNVYHPLKFGLRSAHLHAAALDIQPHAEVHRRLSRGPTQSLEGETIQLPAPPSRPVGQPVLVAGSEPPVGSALPVTPTPTPVLVELPSAAAVKPVHPVDADRAVLIAPPLLLGKSSARVCVKAAPIPTITVAATPATSTQPSTTTTIAIISTITSPLAPPSITPIVAAYYADWTGDQLAPEAVDFDRFDWVDFAFAVPDSSFTLIFTEDDSETLLTRLVTAAHAKGKFVKLSVGGWTGSKHFSTAVSTSANRKTFVRNILQVYNQFSIDGIDIDWEYPGHMGQDGNIVSPTDSANFILFLNALRAALPAGAVITAATQAWPFAGPDGSPMSDVSAFAAVLDWILIMNYDVWGSSSIPGPNAPLSNACKNSTQPLANAVAAIKSWTAAGMPANQITLGLPSYGYISKSSATHLVSKRSLILANDDGGTEDGQISFSAIISQRALKLQDGAYVGAGGYKRNWDDCSSTPFLRSESAGQVITYDDPESIQLKGAFALKAGIRGVNMFDAHGDTASWELIDAARQGLGII
ncbi:hypothetical protein FRB94_000025 [Tulasnella sp. JGI-2019a]|nr:hypothetical protein FRB94_000025 [Tulasnella sp. JGI-2019a]